MNEQNFCNALPVGRFSERPLNFPENFKLRSHMLLPTALNCSINIADPFGGAFRVQCKLPPNDAPGE